MNAAFTNRFMYCVDFLSLNILSNKRNVPNRKLNHKFSSKLKVFINIDVRYKYDKIFESTIKLRDY